MVEPTKENGIGSLSARDLTNAFVDLTAAVTGQKIPKPPLPEKFFQIAGASKGEGPFIDINLNLGLDAGLEMGGKLVVFDTTMGVVETAVIKPTHGIEIKAYTDVNLPFGGVIKLPKSEIDIAITVDNITDPHIRIRSETVKLLGTGGAFEISIDKKKQVGIVEGAAPFGLFNASIVLESATQSVKKAGFSATGIIEGDFFSRFADGVQTATADIAKGVESAVAGMNNEIHVFTGRLSGAKIDKEKSVNDLNRARKSAYREFDKALAEVDKLNKKYKKEKGKCGSPPWKWDHCVAAGALWTSLKVAKGVLKVAQTIVDEFLKGTGKVLAKVIDGLNKAIKGFAKTIEVTGNALGSAMSTFGKTVELAGKFAGEALSKVAEIFDVEKLWMKGKLAVLNASQSGALGVQYTLMGKEYLKDVNWDFKVPIEKIFDVFTPGSSSNKTPSKRTASNEKSIAKTPKSLTDDKGGLPGKGAPKPVKVAGKFTYNPVTTAKARGFAESMIESGELKALSTPFNPEICESHPYALEEQIKTVADELVAVTWRQRNAEIGGWVWAMERSRAFKGAISSPKSEFRWVHAKNRRLPANSFSGGSEPGRSRLYVCRAKYNGKWASGKVVSGYCNIGFYGKERKMSSYDVLTTTNSRVASWRTSKSNGVFVGKEGKQNVYVCRVRYKNGWHPGKKPNSSCYIGYGGKERKFTSGYQTLHANKIVGHDLTRLVNEYKAAKTSYNDRNGKAKYDKQNRISRNLSSYLKKAPRSHAARKEIYANLNKFKPKQQLDPAFLYSQKQRLDALYKELLALRKDPVSPCGQIAKESGVKSQPAQARRKGSGPFTGLAASIQLAQSKMAKAVNDAAKKTAKSQKSTQQKQRAAAKKRRLIAFTKKIKAYEAAAKRTTAKRAKISKARAKILVKPKSRNAKRAASAAKLAALNVKRAKVGASKKKRARPRTRTRARSTARRGVRAKNLRLAQRRAFSKRKQNAFARSFAKHGARVKARSPAQLQKIAKRRAKRITKRQNIMKKRLAGVRGMSAAQRKALVQAFAKASVRTRAQMRKLVPVSRKSKLAGRASATGQAKKATSTIVRDVAKVKTSYRKNLRKLGIRIR